MDRTADAFDGTLGAKIRAGRYGPVFLGTRTTGDLVEVEVLEKPTSETEVQHLLSQLRRRQSIPDQGNIISFQGFQDTKTRIYILTEWLPEGSLQELVRNSGPIPQPLARTFLRQILAGLEHLHRHGMPAVLLDSAHVAVTSKGTVKIHADPFFLDVATAGVPPTLPPAASKLPEVVLGQQDMRSADVWLLGMVAAEMLSGDSDIILSIGDNLAPENEDGKGSALARLLPQPKRDKLDEAALDFLSQCFIM